MIKILSLIFLILLLIVGRMRGFKTFITFYLSLILIIIYLLLMSFGFNAIIVSIIICILSSCVSLFILNGYNKKTIAAFKAIMCVLIFIFLLTFIIGSRANIQGFSMESIETVGGFSLDVNYSMTNLFIGMYLVCAIGTIIDTSISISSALNEVYENNKKLKEKELFLSGMNIGKDILGTTINTLFFALLSSFIGFMMWHKEASLEFIINYQTFVQSVFELFIAFIGSILVIPFSSFISSKMLTNKKYDVVDKE
jgi:uncharacterized membrane protein